MIVDILAQGELEGIFKYCEKREAKGVAGWVKLEFTSSAHILIMVTEQEDRNMFAISLFHFNPAILLCLPMYMCQM